MSIRSITVKEAYEIIVKEGDKDKDLIKDMLEAAKEITLSIDRVKGRWSIEVW